jgi:hypothetical protein
MAWSARSSDILPADWTSPTDPFSPYAVRIIIEARDSIFATRRVEYETADWVMVEVARPVTKTSAAATPRTLD